MFNKVLQMVVLCIVGVGVLSTVHAGVVITNNQELTQNLYAYWSTSFEFSDTFKSTSSKIYKFGREQFVQIRGKDIMFYAPDRLQDVIDELYPGDRITVSAIVRTEDVGTIVIALDITIDTHTIKAFAHENGSITPEGGDAVSTWRDRNICYSS